MNITVITALIAAIAAIVSPTINTIITCKSNKELSELNTITTRKLDVIENYLRYASQASYLPGIPDEFAFYKSAIFLYAPEEIHSKIMKLNTLIEGSEFSDQASLLLFEIAQALRSVNNVNK